MSSKPKRLPNLIGEANGENKRLSKNVHSLSIGKESALNEISDTFGHHTQEIAGNNTEACPLRKSLFTSVPPCLNFTTCNEKMMKLPHEISSLLTWKESDITPLMMIKIIRNSGFTYAKNEDLWLTTWDKQVRCTKFRFFKENQKVNHFPGTYHLGRKDKLWLNILRMQELNGEENFDFVPQTFILPQDIRQLRIAWLETGPEPRWIIKPPASSQGNGISVVSHWDDIPISKPVIVQRYINRPYLINDTKFDLRVYVLVTSFNPLRLYIFEDGLVRFASEKYSMSCQHLDKNFVHLTNYAINRTNSHYVINNSEDLPDGHKWSLKCLWSYFRENGIDDRKIWFSLVDVVVKTLISCERPVDKLVKIHSKNRYSCYELFGFDIILDRSLKPWLLEVNMSPSLYANTPLDSKIKGELIKDIFNTVGFHIPVEVDINSTDELQLFLKKEGIDPCNSISWDKRLYQFGINELEKQKQIKFRQGTLSQPSILRNLTADDIRQLVQSEDELARCGKFIRIFPSKTSSPYLEFFERPKYYNFLLDAWERMFWTKREAGIILLQSFCKKGLHLISEYETETNTKSIVSKKLPSSFKKSDKVSSNYHKSLKREEMKTKRGYGNFLQTHTPLRLAFIKRKTKLLGDLDK